MGDDISLLEQSLFFDENKPIHAETLWQISGTMSFPKPLESTMTLTEENRTGKCYLKWFTSTSGHILVDHVI